MGSLFIAWAIEGGTSGWGERGQYWGHVMLIRVVRCYLLGVRACLSRRACLRAHLPVVASGSCCLRASFLDLRSGLGMV